MADVVEYDREAITKALTVLAFCNGNVKMACRKLDDMGAATPHQATLANWRKRHPEIYEDAVSRHTELFTDEADELVRSTVTFNQRAVARLHEELDDMDPKDISNAARNMAVVGGLMYDKSALAKGQPTARVEVTDAARVLEELNKLAERASSGVIDSTAEELDEES
jgi:hypothetical protein